MNKIIKINTEDKKYNIEIKYNYINKKLLKLFKQNNKIFLIIDKKVDYILKNVSFQNNVKIIKINASEKIKNFRNYQFIINKILSKGIDRNSSIIAIGGGTVGDMAGFISSTILRGVKLILIPTTLLSQVDSSIGGKNGINTKYGKNLIGTFYQPSEVIIDPKILETLSKRELKSGYAEVVKHSLINDKNFFNWLEKNHKKILKLEKNALIYGIYKSIKIKSIYVNKDTKEKLINNFSRAILNFGHTFGHALESMYQYKKTITHGEAISIGMIIASEISNKIGYLTIDELDQIKKHFLMVGLPTKDKKIYDKKIIKIIQSDKKNNNNKINLILLKKIGKAYFAKNVNLKKIFQNIN